MIRRMIRPCILAILVAASALPFSGCGDAMSRGMVITGDGKFGANNARNQRENAQDVLRNAIIDDLGTGWGVNVAISEIPEWVDDRIGEDGSWKWRRITAMVEISPPAGRELPDGKLEEYRRDARTYLNAKLITRDPANLDLTIRLAAGQAVQAQAPAAVARPAGPRTYVVLEGDTLADISTVFYGSPQHWRRILEANPGLTADAVKPGVRLAVP